MANEVTDEKSDPRIKFGNEISVTEKLDATPRLAINSDSGTRLVKFGNTGFQVWAIPDRKTKENIIGNFDYTPEGAFLPVKGAEARHAMILGYSLYSLYKLLRDYEMQMRLGVNVSDVKSIKALTNPQLIDSIANLFDRNGHGSLIKKDTTIGQVEIDLERFGTLKEDDNLIIRLKNYADLAERRQTKVKDYLRI